VTPLIEEKGNQDCRIKSGPLYNGCTVAWHSHNDLELILQDTIIEAGIHCKLFNRIIADDILKYHDQKSMVLG
jgi:hypothetical protein